MNDSSKKPNFQDQMHRELVESTILPMLEAGNIIPWRQNYKGGVPIALKYSDGKPYTGINRLNLPLVSAMRGYKSPYWLTKKMVENGGGKLDCDKTKSVPVAFWRMWNPETNKVVVVGSQGEDSKLNVVGDIEPDGESEDGIEVDTEDNIQEKLEQEKLIPVLRISHVYNGDHVSGIKRLDKMNQEFRALYTTSNSVVESGDQDIERCEKILSADHLCKIKEGLGNKACYVPSIDTIMLPDRDQFNNRATFYHTAFHEIIHSTGNKDRLNRNLDGSKGSQAYALEELIAEIGGWFLSNEAGTMGNVDWKEYGKGKAVDHSIEMNTLAYIQGWAKTIKNNPRIVTMAAQKAEKAYGWVVDPIKLSLRQDMELPKVEPLPAPAPKKPVDEFQKARSMLVSVFEVATDKVRGFAETDFRDEVYDLIADTEGGNQNVTVDKLHDYTNSVLRALRVSGIQTDQTAHVASELNKLGKLDLPNESASHEVTRNRPRRSLRF